MKQLFVVLALLLGVSFAASNSCTVNDVMRTLCSVGRLHDVTNVPTIPSGAPPTNDGFAYSQVSYTATHLYIAGQNGYDSCGRLVPRDYDYETGRQHSLTRIAIAYLNVAAAAECFNMKITDIPGILVTVADAWNSTRFMPSEKINNMLAERSLANWVQIYHWGFNPKMTREFVLADGLSRGDTFEVQALPVPRINVEMPTCLETQIAPLSAKVLLNWTLSGQPPADMDEFLFANTGLRLARGLGQCSNPELRNDDWSRADVVKAPRLGDAGDLLQGENWNNAKIQTRCIAVPSRTDSIQSVPAANLFVRTAGVFQAGKPVFVLAHGTSASHNYWLRAGLLLSRTGYVVMIDLRGHGQSQVTPATVPFAGGLRYTYELFADDVEAVLVALGLGVDDKIIYAGISIGASIGLRLAAKYPQRVGRLVSVSGSPQFRCADHPNVSCKPYLTGVFTTPITLLPEDVLSGCNVSQARSKINQNRASDVSGIAVTSLIEYSQKEDLTPILAQVKCPTLVVHGLGDSTLGVGAADAIASGVLQASRVDFVNRGHLLPITSPTDMANIITRFSQSASFPKQTIVFDIGQCDVAPEVAPEPSFSKCQSV